MDKERYIIKRNKSDTNNLHSSFLICLDVLEYFINVTLLIISVIYCPGEGEKLRTHEVWKCRDQIWLWGVSLDELAWIENHQFIFSSMDTSYRSPHDSSI